MILNLTPAEVEALADGQLPASVTLKAMRVIGPRVPVLIPGQLNIDGEEAE